MYIPKNNSLELDLDNLSKYYSTTKNTENKEDYKAFQDKNNYLSIIIENEDYYYYENENENETAASSLNLCIAGIAESNGRVFSHDLTQEVDVLNVSCITEYDESN